ncbi:unnamed protein product [Cuscuta epithymum]|uniref:Uncharacterized protein n=1 Tax=Cuscuta epithymum TaxID=186058 RepID=A0AAV0EQ72_9ASTE|nr:unnamed protein product [Cuscuta epithymum]
MQTADPPPTESRNLPQATLHSMEATICRCRFTFRPAYSLLAAAAPPYAYSPLLLRLLPTRRCSAFCLLAAAPLPPAYSSPLLRLPSSRSLAREYKSNSREQRSG